MCMQKKILIVEDDVTTSEMLKMLIQKAGYDVVAEKNGLKVYEVAKEIHPDLILLDAVLPGLDGYSIQKKLYGDPETKTIPIIMMTAHAQLDQVFAGKDNVVGFIHKPFDINELQGKIRAGTKDQLP